MKIAKAVLLVATVVFAVALLGSTAATAETTALCQEDESACKFPLSHTHYTTEGLEINNSFVTYKCNGLYLANVNALGAPQLLEGTFVYSNCDHGCERIEENGPVLLDLLKTGHETAELIGLEGAVIHSICSGLNCVYSFENLVGTAKGPLLAGASNGEFFFESATLTHVSGTLCPPVSKLTARYILLSKAYISS